MSDWGTYGKGKPMLTKEDLQSEIDALEQQKEKVLQTVEEIEDKKRKAITFLQKTDGAIQILAKLIGQIERSESESQPENAGTVTL